MITALASAYASPQRGAMPPPASVTGAVPPLASVANRADKSSDEAAASRSEAAQRSRRNPLMDAMMSATGLRERASNDQPVEGSAAVEDAVKSDSGAADEAVARFAHALMDDLRQIAGSGEAQNWSDLSGSVGTLAVKASASAGAAIAPAAASTETLASAPKKIAEVEVPPQPNPLTPTSAAVHLMQVPSSHLLEAYAAMRSAMPQADTRASSSADSAETRAELAQFLDKVSQSLAPQAKGTPSMSGLGALLDTRA